MALNFLFKKHSSSLLSEPDNTCSDKIFHDAINLFKTRRKKAGISLEQLSRETKISRSVLIAIENGSKKHLPEKIYLISMIKSIESKLNLEGGSLNGLLIQTDTIISISRFKFNFINIDFLNSWVGSLLYILFMLLSILALNSQQRYLIKINSVSTEPIITEKIIIKNRPIVNNQKDK